MRPKNVVLVARQLTLHTPCTSRHRVCLYYSSLPSFALYLLFWQIRESVRLHIIAPLSLWHFSTFVSLCKCNTDFIFFAASQHYLDTVIIDSADCRASVVPRKLLSYGVTRSTLCGTIWIKSPHCHDGGLKRQMSRSPLVAFVSNLHGLFMLNSTSKNVPAVQRCSSFLDAVNAAAKLHVIDSCSCALFLAARVRRGNADLLWTSQEFMQVETFQVDWTLGAPTGRSECLLSPRAHISHNQRGSTELKVQLFLESQRIEREESINRQRSQHQTHLWRH